MKRIVLISSLALLACTTSSAPEPEPVPTPDVQVPARHPDAPAADLTVWLPPAVPALTPAGPRPVREDTTAGVTTWAGAAGDGDLRVLLAPGPPDDPATAGPRRWTGRTTVAVGDRVVVRGMGGFTVTEVDADGADLEGETSKLTLPPGTTAAWVLAPPTAAEAARALAILRLPAVPPDSRPAPVRRRDVEETLRNGTLLDRAQALRRVWTLDDADYQPRKHARLLEADLLPLLAPHAGRDVDALRRELHEAVGFDNTMPQGMTPEGPPPSKDPSP